MSSPPEVPLPPSQTGETTLGGHMVPRAGNVVVKVLIRGMPCSDNGRMGELATLTSNILKGHGSAGEVIAVGSGVTTLECKDYVAIEPTTSCGQYTSCTNAVAASAESSAPETYYVLPEGLCTKIPKPLTIYEGALVEPLAIAVNLIREADISDRNTVVIFGASFIGILCCILARSKGAMRVIMVDEDTAKLELAKAFTEVEVFTIGYPRDAKESAKMLMLEPGADVVINAAGDDEFIDTARCALKNGGTYIQAGVRPSEVSFDVLELWSDIQVKGNIRYAPGDFCRAVGLLANGEVDVSRFGQFFNI